jgi:hypothetical protein
MELCCIEVVVSNGNFEMLSRNLGFKPGYTFCEFSQIAHDPASKIRVSTVGS